MGKYLRVRVNLDLKKSMAHGRTIKLGSRSMWVPNRYEKLPIIHLNCSMFCHGDQGCTHSSGSSKLSKGETQYGS